MKIGTTLGVLAAAGLVASASAQNRGVEMGGGFGTGHGEVHGGFGGDSPVVYSQPEQDSNGYFSDGVPGQYWSQRVADNFTLDNNYAIDGIRWWGSSENYTDPDLGNFKNFVIEFYGDGGGMPGSSLGSFVIDVGSCNPVPTGLQNGLGGNDYQFEAPVNVNLLGGVPYWVSVGTENVDPGLDGWAWSANFDHDLALSFDFFDGNGYQTFDAGQDNAFELMGAVPAPGSAALLGLGGLLAARRRRV